MGPKVFLQLISKEIMIRFITIFIIECFYLVLPEENFTIGKEMAASEKDIKFIVEDKDTNRAEYYPESELRGRGRLAYNWLPEKSENILDGGCSYGYITSHLSKKSQNTYALDLDFKHIEIAKGRYPEIHFNIGSIEETEFEDDFFDAIVLTDVLEHTSDRIKTLSEIHRILKPGGSLILTTPHKGLFGFLDPYNYGYYFKKLLPWIYKPLYKTIRRIKEGKWPQEFNPLHNVKHYHYSLNDFRRMLSESAFKDNYKIEKVLRSGLFIEVFMMNLETFLGIIFNKKILDFLLKPIRFISMIDYKINYGPLGYNIAVKVVKE